MAENNLQPSMKKESVRVQWEMSGGKSRMQRYGELVVGKTGFWSILKYEIIIQLCCATPGALGLWIRSKLYPKLLAKCGRNVFFGANVTLRHPNKIELGDNVIIDDNCLLDAKGWDNKGIRVGHGVFLGRNSILSCKNGDIELADNVNIGFNAEVFSGSHVTVGEDTHIAAYCYLIGGDHDVDDTAESITEQGSTSHGITVGANCWFGASVKVIDKVNIGDHVVIGAGAVVTKDIPDNSVSVGIPARVVKKRRQTTDDR